MTKRPVILMARLTLVAVFAAAGCVGPSGGDGNGSGGATGSGGKTSGTGGATITGSGGATVTGSGGAMVSSGGTPGGSSSGGSTGTGGASNGGSSSGGSNATGGAANGGSSSGGSKGTGGSSSGGSKGMGGSATGGSNAAGGSSSGGSNAAGGSSSGGSNAAGGSAGGGSSGSAACASGITDARQDLLSKYTPTSSDLAKLFKSYVNGEIGTPTIGTVGTGTARTITAPIYVPACVSYDGKGEKLTGKGMGDGSQDEGQQPIFILAPGASVKNVTITAPGCEGIHMMGNNVVENVVWEDVGEDAASIRSYFPGGTILISGGSAKSAEDKTFQFNVPATVTIRNFKATDIGKLVRQNGGKDFPLAIILDTVTANDVKDAVVMSDSPQCTVKATNLTTNASTVFDGCRKI